MTPSGNVRNSRRPQRDFHRIEYDGSLSGAQVKEAISWGKVRPLARKTTLIADATTALPLVACYAMTNRKKRL
jgi:deoxyhypusine synthase